MTDWQPIATAPRDGTIVLATWADTWANGAPHAEACYLDAECDGGTWFYAYDSDGPSKPPTHWMPLPPPPREVQP